MLLVSTHPRLNFSALVNPLIKSGRIMAIKVEFEYDRKNFPRRDFVPKGALFTRDPETQGLLFDMIGASTKSFTQYFVTKIELPEAGWKISVDNDYINRFEAVVIEGDTKLILLRKIIRAMLVKIMRYLLAMIERETRLGVDYRLYDYLEWDDSWESAGILEVADIVRSDVSDTAGVVKEMVNAGDLVESDVSDTAGVVKEMVNAGDLVESDVSDMAGAVKEMVNTGDFVEVVDFVDSDAVGIVDVDAEDFVGNGKENEN
jgi:hypothetical protein